MHLEAKGTAFTHHLQEEIGLLTGNSSLLLATFRHDQEAARLSFTLDRRPLIALERRMLGTVDTPSYAREGCVLARVEIGGVAGIEVQRSGAESQVDRVRLERGLYVTKDAVVLSSVEELHGQKFFEATVRLTGFWIRIADEGED